MRVREKAAADMAEAIEMIENGDYGYMMSELIRLEEETLESCRDDLDPDQLAEISKLIEDSVEKLRTAKAAMDRVWEWFN